MQINFIFEEPAKKLKHATAATCNKPGFRPVSWQQQGYCFMLNAEKCAKHWESLLKADKCWKKWENVLKAERVS
jgi:hypothetical protein